MAELAEVRRARRAGHAAPRTPRYTVTALGLAAPQPLAARRRPCARPLRPAANAAAVIRFQRINQPIQPCLFALQVVASIKPDGFTPKIVAQTSNYLYAEFEVSAPLPPPNPNTLPLPALSRVRGPTLAALLRPPLRTVLRSPL